MKEAVALLLFWLSVISMFICMCISLCGSEEDFDSSSAQDHGLDTAAISTSPISTFSQIKGAASSACTCCAICLGDYEEGEAVRLLPECRHVFHKSCIDQWLMNHSTCPLCRHSLLPMPPPPAVAV